MSKQTLDRSILDIINDPDSGTPEDKLRLFIIYYLCSNMSDVSEINLKPFSDSTRYLTSYCFYRLNITNTKVP